MDTLERIHEIDQEIRDEFKRSGNPDAFELLFDPSVDSSFLK